MSRSRQRPRLRIASEERVRQAEVHPGQLGGGAQLRGADVAAQVACAQGSPRFQVSEHGDDAAVITVPWRPPGPGGYEITQQNHMSNNMVRQAVSLFHPAISRA